MGVRVVLLLLFSISSCLCEEILLRPNSCEQSCLTSRPKEVSQKNYDALCHRGCRLFRIVYMLSHPFTDHHVVGRQCNASCADGYSKKQHQAACSDGCGLQSRRLGLFQQMNTEILSGHEQADLQSNSIENLFHSLGPSGPAPEQSIKRLHMWTLIRSSRFPRLVIIRTEHSQPVTGVHLAGQIMMAEAAPPSGQQLELGGVRDTPALNAAVPMLKKKQRDFWWVCVLDRTLQPLMAGLLMLSFLILLWLCLSYAKELATGPVNSEIAVKPKEMPKLDLMLIDPISADAAPEKVALFKVPLENV